MVVQIRLLILKTSLKEHTNCKLHLRRCHIVTVLEITVEVALLSVLSAFIGYKKTKQSPLFNPRLSKLVYWASNIEPGNKIQKKKLQSRTSIKILLILH